MSIDTSKVATTNAANGSADQCLLVTAGTPTVAKTFGAATIADGACGRDSVNVGDAKGV